MANWITTAIAFFLLSSTAQVAPKKPTDEQLRLFEARVRPILTEQCIRCHGPKKQQGGLRLDNASGILDGGDNGPVVVAGKPLESRLIKAVRHDGMKMPPDKRLSASEIAALADWVRDGAIWPSESGIRKRGEITAEDRNFWAFQPVRDPTVPEVVHVEWTRNAIDRFIVQRLEKAGVKQARKADPLTLLRRVSFDLTGIPPTPEEVMEFLQDKRPDAYERVVERLLASPAYGERYGRHWLDVVRYADTAGDNSDYPVPDAYRYRNWVIGTTNEDRPYDRFLQEQLAGDLMGGTPEQVQERTIATGYLAISRRFGSYEDKRYQWWLTFEDTIENVGRSILGLSLSCSRCHDHKFDPIPSEDYYALYGFFQSTRYPWPGIELDKRPRDMVHLASADEVVRAEQVRKEQLASIDKRLASIGKDTKHADTVRKERERIAQAPLNVPTAYAVAEGKRWVGDARVQLAGDPTRLGKRVPRRFLSILGGQSLPKTIEGSGRRELAGWLTDQKNPLTARVAVNRLWLHHFGRGLVATPNDFGRQGQPPSHPELLDYLATKFIESGWSRKAIHRLILLSQTYQLSSEENEARFRIDPDNALLSRANRRRLDAESIRDSLLALAGILDRSPGGPHPFPDVTKWDYTQHKPFKAVYETDRRSIYLMTQRIQRHPYLALFDGADTNASTARRMSSTTPLQALYLMNDGFVHRLAEGFANRLLQEGQTDQGRIRRSFELAFGRPPGTDEVEAALGYLVQARQKHKGSEQLVWAGYARGLFLASELIYLD